MATESDIRAWIAGYRRDFNQLCQALMWQLANRFGTVVSTPGSAIAAYRIERNAGRIKGGTPPPGAFVYFDIGSDGHVGFMVNGGRVFMGSTKVDEQWSNWNTGPQGIGDYCAMTGATYLGWSYQNGGNTVPFSASGSTAGGGGTNYAFGLTLDAMKATQGALAKLGLYTGPVDGDFGPNSVGAFQQYLKNVGLLAGDYTVDGEPGPIYGAAVQSLAAKHGYTGPIDGDPGTQTSAGIVAWGASVTAAPSAPATDWKKWQAFLAAYGYTGPVDGDPGVNTYTALQKFLAEKYQYTGPIDGDPGEFTWAAFARAVAAGEPKAGTVPTSPSEPTPVEPSTLGAFGIDIATTQRDIDLGVAKAQGVEFVIVKAGGYNVSPQYVAPHYHAQIDKAVAAGLPKGHYYLPGNKSTPTQQADYFVDNLYRFDVAHDVLALDNEPLDSNAVFWKQDQVMEFINRVHERTGIPYSRIWLYAPAAKTRAEGPWDKVTATAVKVWWAAYGGSPTGREPDHEPSLQGKIARWDVHQYSSSVSVAGYALDGNRAKLPVAELFATGTVGTPPSEPEVPGQPSDVARLIAAIDAALAPFRE